MNREVSAGSRDFRIIHFSDTHEPAVFPQCGLLPDKRILGFLNSRVFRAHAYDRTRLGSLVPEILSNPPDLIAYTGDAVSTSAPREFEKALELLLPLAESGIPLVYTPGNHDCYVRDRACRAAMEHFYHMIMRGKREYADSPYSFSLGPLRFAAIHCSRPSPWISSNGFMNRETSDFLISEASGASDIPFVCIGHFPIRERHPFRNYRHMMLGAKKVSNLLDAGKIALSLCGHTHQGYADTDARGYGEICAGSLTKHGRYAEIRYSPATKSFHTQFKTVNS